MDPALNRGGVDERERSRLAREAALLLNEAIRDLLIPQHLDDLAEKWQAGGHVSERYASSVARAAMMSAVMVLYRLHEIRSDFLLWLFEEADLERLGLPPVETFVGNWGAFMVVRGQFVGHARRKETHGRRPGQVVPAEELGKATKRCGMVAQAEFLLRLREHLVPGVERLRDELFRLYPEARRFVTEIYGNDFKRGAGIE